jgi:CheY-like chemotaxis protein
MQWRVLIADDDLEICSLIKTILGRGPYDLTVCHDGETALERVENDTNYDLLISDFMLPGINGLDLISRVRENPATADLPIVMITGQEPEVMDALSKAAGATAFLSKPFALGEFRATVSRLLSDPLQAASGA